MDPLGDYLKQAREKKGVSFEQISSQTRIQEYHLQALESEDFAKLPAKVFAKGFVRSYAKALGLDEEEVLQRFLQTSATFYDQQEPDAQEPHVQVTLEAPPRQGPNWSLVLGIIVILAIITVWYGFPKKQEIQPPLPEAEVPQAIEPINEPILPIADSQKSGEPIKAIDSVPTPPPPPAPPAPKPVSTQPLPKPEVPTSAEPTPPPSPTKPANHSTAEGSHTLEIEATQLTWVVVKSDEQTPNEALLQPGQRITWKAETQFQVTLGNAGGVNIRLNGQSQGPFGKPGQVVRDIRLRP